jgi:hypothetical protein
MTPASRRRVLFGAPLALAALGVAATVFAVQRAGVAPRQLGPYVERRASGHNAIIEAAGHWLGTRLVTLDRPADGQDPAWTAASAALQLGARQAPAGSDAAGRVMLVASVAELRAALAAAQPGDAITLLPGTYRIDSALEAGRAGSEQAPITVRARRPGSVVLEQEAGEGFRVHGPYWHFENLTMRGVCRADSDCEHAFHVSGAAHHFAALNNTLVDFNAHFKINGEQGGFPDHGLIDANTLTNTRARRTANPVTPIDLVAASGWTVRRNLISDFVKDGGDGVSYGAFAKGGGAHNLFEQNLVWCERRLVGMAGQRIGLSLGGGATGKPYCRDRACVVEQQQSTIRSNLIASCSDVGIYLNSAAQSSVVYNSVVDTAGIDVRFATSSADFDGNLVDGAIRSRDGSIIRDHDNLSAAPVAAFLGYHPVRALYAAPQALDFAWRADPPRSHSASGPVPPGLCGRARTAPVAYGAFDSFAPCLAAASAATSSSSAAN